MAGYKVYTDDRARVMRSLGEGGKLNEADRKAGLAFDAMTMMEIKKLLVDDPLISPGLEAFSKYSKSLAGEPDSVAISMIDVPDGASEEDLREAMTEFAEAKGIPKIAKKNGVSFTVLETAYTATQSAYEGVQQGIDVEQSKERFTRSTSVMRAYLGGDPSYPEVGGILNEIPEDPASVYEYMLAMGASLKMDSGMPGLALNRFACAETTAAESVIGLEKQQIRVTRSASSKPPNELHLDPAITQDFVKRGQEIVTVLEEVLGKNGMKSEGLYSFGRVKGILDELAAMLQSGGKKRVSPKKVEQDLGILKALFDQDPTAAIKVAEAMKPGGQNQYARVNFVLPMIANRRVGADTFTYLGTRFGSVVQELSDGPLLTRQELSEMRKRGELPEGAEFMIEGGEGEFSKALAETREDATQAVEGRGRGRGRGRGTPRGRGRGGAVRDGRGRGGRLRDGSGIRGGRARDGRSRLDPSKSVSRAEQLKQLAEARDAARAQEARVAVDEGQKPKVAEAKAPAQPKPRGRDDGDDWNWG